MYQNIWNINDNNQCDLCKGTFRGTETRCRYCGALRASANVAPQSTEQCTSCGAILNGKVKYCRFCGALQAEVKVDRSDTKECGNCGKPLAEADKYCRYCATKRGEGKFEPHENIMQCIYGPRPVKRVHKCSNCGRVWETLLMIDNEDYCTNCGSAARIIQEGDDLPENTGSANRQPNLWGTFRK